MKSTKAEVEHYSSCLNKWINTGPIPVTEAQEIYDELVHAGMTVLPIKYLEKK